MTSIETMTSKEEMTSELEMSKFRVCQNFVLERYLCFCVLERYLSRAYAYGKGWPWTP
jgi:hypothetical protein